LGKSHCSSPSFEHDVTIVRAGGDMWNIFWSRIWEHV